MFTATTSFTLGQRRPLSGWSPNEFGRRSGLPSVVGEKREEYHGTPSAITKVQFLFFYLGVPSFHWTELTLEVPRSFEPKD